MFTKRIILLLLVNYCILSHSFIHSDVVKSFFKAKNLNHNVIIVCDNQKVQVEFLKGFTANYKLVIKHIDKINIFNDLVDDYRRMGVVLDGDCPNAANLLQRVS